MYLTFDTFQKVHLFILVFLNLYNKINVACIVAKSGVLGQNYPFSKLKLLVEKFKHVFFSLNQPHSIKNRKFIELTNKITLLLNF